jgi:hypothetical protein
MRVRRAIVGLAMSVAALAAPNRAAALSCFHPPLRDEVTTAGGVFVATIAARRPLDPLLFRVLEWLGHPVMNVTDRLELSLQDVEPLRGSAPPTIRTGYSYLEAGGRYLFIARKRWIGPLVVGPCTGRVFEASQASALKAWISSLNEPPAGGRLFGTVYAPKADWSPGDGLPTASARVIARGPVVVETVADGRGHFGFTGLPDGHYDVSAESLDSSGKVEVSSPSTELLAGDHDAAWVYLFLRPSPTRVAAARR